MGAVHLFGIRHHGPGSARRLLAALDRLRPGAALIEGPADLSGALPALGSARMVAVAVLMAVAGRSRGTFRETWVLAWQPEYAVALLATLPPLADTLRYGTARDMATDQLAALFERLVLQAAIALPHAARNLDAEAARRLHGLLTGRRLSRAIRPPRPPPSSRVASSAPG